VTVTSSVGIIPLMVQVSIPRVDPNFRHARPLGIGIVIPEGGRGGPSGGVSVGTGRANCHVTPTIGKTGKALYVAACGICHEGETSRLDGAPSAAPSTNPPIAACWTQWVSEGRVGSLMPAFASKNGGILSPHQVKTLVEYLSGEFQNESSIPGAPSPALAPAPAVPGQSRSRVEVIGVRAGRL
jgi:cytochrome c5